jgi:L-fuculose-phosphate aldolase
MAAQNVELQHLALKQEIIATCLKLEELGFTIGTYGNVSARVTEGLLVTPSRVDYAAMTPEDIVTVSLSGEVLNGIRLPSSEMDVHRLVYVNRPDVGGVIHSHSLYATALSCLHDTIPVIVEEQSQVIGAEIHCTQYVPAGQHLALGEEVARALGSSNSVLLANHGTLSCGRTLAEALFATRITERIAQMRLMTLGAGSVVPIPEEYVRSERERWLYKYGTQADRRH